MIYQFLRDIDYPRSLYVPFVIKVDETDQKSKGISVSLDLFKHQFGIALQGIGASGEARRNKIARGENRNALETDPTANCSY